MSKTKLQTLTRKSLVTLIFTLGTAQAGPLPTHHRPPMASRGQAVALRKLLLHSPSILRQEMDRWDSRPSIWPCYGQFSSPFGTRFHPLLGYAKFHPGCDICHDWGTPIRATAAGTVVSADWLGGYGLVVKIDHGHHLTTLYAHCDRVHVKAGQFVHKGQQIAEMGSTGLATGPHCHYEVHYKGEQIDPAPFMKDRPIPQNVP